MLGFLKKLLTFSKSEANDALDKAEDPIKLTEQGIKDLKTDLSESLKALAEVKALAIRTRREADMAYKAAEEYEKRAVQILKKAELGDIPQAEADRLAMQALSQKDKSLQAAQNQEKNIARYDEMVRKMEANALHIKDQVTEWENELRTLKARSKMNQATLKLNEKLNRLDSGNTIDMLEKMKEKIDKDEFVSDALHSSALLRDPVEDQVDKILGINSNTSKPLENKGDDPLLALRQKARFEIEEDAKKPKIEFKKPEESPNQNASSQLQKLSEEIEALRRNANNKNSPM